MRPTSIKVGPFMFKVTYQDEVKHAESKEAVDAYCDHGNHLIVIGTENYSEDFIRSSLWHELKHAVCRLSVDSDHKKMTEEKFIQLTCNMELAVLRDNPELVPYLLGDER